VKAPAAFAARPAEGGARCHRRRRCDRAWRRSRPARRRLAAAGFALGLALGAGTAQRSFGAGGPMHGGPVRVLPGGAIRPPLPPRRGGPPLTGAALAAGRQAPLPPPGFVVPGPPRPPQPAYPPRMRPPSRAEVRDAYRLQRLDMVNLQLRQRGITQPEVLAAMAQVPRQLFLPIRMRAEAYADRALQVGPSRTIYQPYVVALMTSLLDLKHGDSVLEVGTGTGYHAAVLSRIARQVYSIEIDPVAASQAGKALAVMGYHNVEVWLGDGYRGLAERAPFNAILLSAAPPRIPAPLIDQLRVGGKMVAPVGGGVQDLLVITKTAQGIEKRTVAPIRVSPMTGQVQDGQ
jgi:protein-L-isoaspartate(D-aspartate) O-methyltransferase